MVGEQQPATADGTGRAPVRADVELVEFDRATCVRLLATGQVGRIVFTEGALAPGSRRGLPPLLEAAPSP
jgi:hypothetical protein